MTTVDDQTPVAARAARATTIALAVLFALIAAIVQATPAAAVRGGFTLTTAEPWVVRIVSSGFGGWLCSGSLISPNHVLTAAHCVVEDGRTDMPGNIGLRIGATNGSDGELRSVRTIEVHPRYRESGDPEFAYDAAVLTLTSPSTRTPIDIASPEAPSDEAAALPGTYAYVLGYGITYEDRGDSGTLRKARQRIWSGRAGEDFFDAFYDDRFSRTLQIAAGGDGESAICDGDSGGPLIVYTPTGPKQIGISSWSDTQYFESACDPDEPGVFTRLNGHEIHPWVEAHVRETPLVGDFDGDGRDDILTLTHGPRADVYVALSTGSGFASSRIWHGWAGHDGTHARVGDVDGDGRDDLWVLDNTYSRVWVMRSLGDRFDNAWAQNLYGYGSVVLADVDGDGDSDLVKASPFGLYLYRSAGSSLAYAGTSSHGVPGTHRAGDVDGDGDDDLVTFDQGVRGNDAWVMRSTGSGFSSPERWHDYFAPTGEQPYVGRFGWTRRADIVTFVPRYDDVWVGLSSGSQFSSSRWHTDFGSRTTSTRMIGDFNGDGYDDLVEFAQDASGDVFVALRHPWYDRFHGTTLWHPYFAIGGVARW